MQTRHLNQLRRRCVFAAAAAVILQAVHASPVAAQTSVAPTVNPRESARIRLGPLYMTPALPLVGIGVDTNVFNSSLDPRSDVTATANPSLDLWVPMARRALISTSFSADLVYFKEFSSQRSVNPSVNVRGELFSRFVTLFAGRGYSRSKQRSNLEIDTRSRYVSIDNRAGAILALGTRTAAEVSAFQRETTYDRGEEFLGTNLAQALNREEYGAQLDLRHRLTSFTTLLASASVQRDRFDESSERNSDSTRLTTGFAFNPRALISGRAEVGLRQFKTRDAALPDYTGIVAATSVVYTLRQRTQFSVTWDRDVSYSYQADTPYFVANGIGLQIQRQIRGNLDAGLGAQRTTYAYRGFSSSLVTPERTDVTTSYSADIGYRLNRNLRMSFGATVLERAVPDDPSRGYRATRAALSVAYVLPS